MSIVQIVDRRKLVSLQFYNKTEDDKRHTILALNVDEFFS